MMHVEITNLQWWWKRSRHSYNRNGKSSLWPNRSRTLTFSRAFTCCDIAYLYCGRGKKTNFEKWNWYLNMTQTSKILFEDSLHTLTHTPLSIFPFLSLSLSLSLYIYICISHGFFKEIYWFLILMYQRASPLNNLLSRKKLSGHVISPMYEITSGDQTSSFLNQLNEDGRKSKTNTTRSYHVWGCKNMPWTNYERKKSCRGNCKCQKGDHCTRSFHKESSCKKITWRS